MACTLTRASSGYYYSPRLLINKLSPQVTTNPLLHILPPNNLPSSSFRRSFSSISSSHNFSQHTTLTSTTTTTTTTTPTCISYYNTKYLSRNYAVASQPPTPPSTPSSTKTNLVFDVATCSIPHPSKAYKGGEDAFFVSKDKNALGVADGVGGWGEEGIDPALYAKGIMEGARKFYEEKGIKQPQEIMHAGWVYASTIEGSSTCCICVLDGGYLHSANLGDSGFMIVREHTMLFRTKEQQHDFNFPYQLGMHSTDRPKHADIEKIEVRTGDVLIMGTDGLFDNMYDSDIVAVVMQEAKDPQAMAKLIGQRASVAAKKKTGRSPFADLAEKAQLSFEGGKLDDITVVVAKVNVKS